jgi:soluble lytic murein transglycosylase-like protein
VDETPVTPEPQPAPQPVALTTTEPSAAQPAAVASQTPAKVAQNMDLEQVVREASSKNRLDPDFVSSVIRAESNFKTHAVSKKGAQGLMQLMPATAAQLGVADAFDPRANVEAGTAHLSALLDLYNNDPIRALAAYNAGAHRVKQYHGVPPYRETRDYINKIVRDFNAKKRAQMKAAAATNASTATKTASPKPVKKAKPQQASVAKSANPA